MSILQAAPLLAGGGAVAGAGLALGQDAYRGAKRNIGFILLLIVVGSALYGSYKVGVWWGRNYKDWLYGLIARVGGLIVLTVCWLGTRIVGIIFLPALVPPLPLLEMLPEHIDHFLTFQTGAGAITLGLLSFTGLGVLVGLGSRPKRSRRWATDAHNTAFFEYHGLQEIQEDRLRDAENTGYSLANALPGELEFKVLGQADMYAYLTFDEAGRYTAWSSGVPQR